MLMNYQKEIVMINWNLSEFEKEASKSRLLVSILAIEHELKIIKSRRLRVNKIY